MRPSPVPLLVRSSKAATSLTHPRLACSIARTARSGRSQSSSGRHASTNASIRSSSSASSLPFPPAPPPRTTPRVGTLFLALTLSGLLATGYGIYQFYQTFQTWPKELRAPLRTALKAKMRGDARRAEAAFRSALEIARYMPPSQLSPSPILKTTGIAIALASLLEEEGQLPAAYEVYLSALEEVNTPPQSDGQGAPSVRTPEERMRAVAIAQRLGDLAAAGALEGSALSADEEAERHLSWSVEELLRLAVPQGGAASSQLKRTADGGILLSDLALPSWVTRTDLGASLEALGAHYASRGEVSYAVPLYMQALTLLMPPPQPGASSRSPELEPDAAGRCHAGVLMNNLAQLFLIAERSGDLDKAQKSAASKSKVDAGSDLRGAAQGLAWATKGLEIVQSTNQLAGWSTGDKTVYKIKSVKLPEDDEEKKQVQQDCARAEVALLYNLGVMCEMTKDVCSAREYLQKGYRKADEAGMREARNRCAQALAGLERIGSRGKVEVKGR